MKVVHTINSVYDLQRKALKSITIKTTPLITRDTLMLHGFGEDVEGPWWANNGFDGINSIEIAKFFVRNPIYTGGMMAYPLVIFPAIGQQPARIEQARTLNEITPHGRRWNTRALALCFAGTIHNAKPMPREQWDLGVEVIAMFLRMRPSLTVIGHDQAAHATKDSDKVCPNFDVQRMHEQACEINSTLAWGCGQQWQNSARKQLLDAGFIF